MVQSLRQSIFYGSSLVFLRFRLACDCGNKAEHRGKASSQPMLIRSRPSCLGHNKGDIQKLGVGASKRGQGIYCRWGAGRSARRSCGWRAEAGKEMHLGPAGVSIAVRRGELLTRDNPGLKEKIMNKKSVPLRAFL